MFHKGRYADDLIWLFILSELHGTPLHKNDKPHAWGINKEERAKIFRNISILFDHMKAVTDYMDERLFRGLRQRYEEDTGPVSAEITSAWTNWLS